MQSSPARPLGALPRSFGRPSPIVPSSGGPPTGSRRTFKFVFNGDANGIFYFLGTNQGAQAWTNPHTAGFMACVMSSVFVDPPMGPARVVDRGTDDNLTGNAFPDADHEWIGFDFGVERLVRPSMYLGQGRSDGSQCPRNWQLEGSNNVAANTIAGFNAATWAVLDSRVDDRTMERAGTVFPWALYVVPPSINYYRWLRIHTTSGNSSGAFILVAVEWEFYGTFF